MNINSEQTCRIFKQFNQRYLQCLTQFNWDYANFLEIIPAGELCSSELVHPPIHVTSPPKTSTFVKAWQASD